jgi:hypothetical protein
MFHYWKLSEKHWKPETEELLTFSQKSQTLDGHSLNIQTLRNNYLKSSDLPKWNRKMRNRRLFLKFSIPTFLFLFTFRKVERLIDFLEYGL